MRPDQLADFRVPSDAHLHPDGKRVAFVVKQMDLDEDTYVSSIWLWDGTEGRMLTSGKADSTPRWSPDGNVLAFLRKGPGEKDRPQLALLPIGGGEADVVTDFELGVSDVSWSPDGASILLQVAEYVDGIEDDDERARAPRKISHPAFRFDNLGWLSDKRSHLWILDTASQETRQVTSGDYSESGASWSPDGSTISFMSARGDDRWVNPLGSVYTVPAAGGEAKQVTPSGQWDWAGFGPDGSLYVIGLATERFKLAAGPLQRLAPDGSLTRITDLDRSLRPGHPPGILAGPRFLADGSIHCLLEDQGMQIEAPANRFDNPDLVNAVDVDPGHSRLIFVRSAGLRIFEFPFFQIPLVIVDDPDATLLGFAFPDVNQGARRGSGSFSSFRNKAPDTGILLG